MKLLMVVLQGPVAGQKFALAPGQVVGRLAGQIILQDPKISGRHAVVEQGKQGELILTDLGSTNGIKINGQRVQSVTLAPGLKLQLGRSLVEIVAAEVAAAPTPTETVATAVAPSPAIRVSPAPQAPKPEPEPEPEKPKTWFEILLDHLNSKQRKIKDRPRVVAPFSPPITLRFLRGLQFETEWVVGYGPRRVGAKSIDFPIWEPQAPDICFEILPTPQGPAFKTVNSGMVLLNGNSIPSATLKSGDLISIFDCLIEVSMSEAGQ